MSYSQFESRQKKRIKKETFYKKMLKFLRLIPIDKYKQNKGEKK